MPMWARSPLTTKHTSLPKPARALRAEEPQELPVGPDEPERGLEVLVGAGEEGFDPAACPPEDHEHVGRLGFPHFLVGPRVDRPRRVDLNLWGDNCLKGLAGVPRRSAAGPLF